MEAAVNSVTIASGITAVTKGLTATFKANVGAVGGADTTVTWSVSGQNSTNTKINTTTGVLEVGADETAATLTVTATSTFNSEKSASVTVNVVNEAQVTFGMLNENTYNPETIGLFYSRDQIGREFEGSRIDGLGANEDDTNWNGYINITVNVPREDTYIMSILCFAGGNQKRAYEVTINGEAKLYTKTTNSDESIGYTSSGAASLNVFELEAPLLAGDNTIKLQGDVAVNKGGPNFVALVVADKVYNEIPVQSITIQPKDGKTTIKVRETLELTSTVEPEDASIQDVIWSSSDPDKASVNSATGVITGKAAGTVTITATAKDGSDVSKSIDITIKEVQVTDIIITEPVQKTVNVKGTLSLTANVVPSDATNQEVVWSSANDAIATVSANPTNTTTATVTGKIAGKVKIRATAQDGSGKKGEIAITVQEEVTITYQAGEGGKIREGEGEAVQEVIQTIVKGSITTPVTAVPDEGYNFVKWVEDGKTDAVRSDTAEADKTFTAEFKKAVITYTVTLDPNGGVLLASQSRTITIEAGKTIGALPEPTWSGYTFEEWYTAKTGGVKVTNATTASNPMTIYAQWKKVVTPPPVGTRFNARNFKFKIVKKASAKANGTVELIAPTKKTITSATIPPTVTSGSFTYNVEKIANKAFSGCKSLKKVTVGKNVKKIGSKAFNGDNKLRKITIKSTKLTSVGRNVFKKIHKKAVIKVPPSKLKKYKNKLKKKGQAKTVVITS